MNNNILKYILFFAITFSLSFLFVFVNSPQRENLSVVFLDVGQGDAILLKTPIGYNILIDGGPDDTLLSELSKALSWRDRRIDLMILTHPHADHVGGLDYVLDRYDVGKILYNGVQHNSPLYESWLEKIEQKEIPLYVAQKGMILQIDEGCTAEIIYALDEFSSDKKLNLNNTSLVIKLRYGNNIFLFTGDIEFEIESELVNSGIDLSADVLKVSHHGSHTSSAFDFLQKISPEIAIIQAGAENKFGHPSRMILSRLEKLNIKTFRTDIAGSIEIVSDGENLKINEKAF